MFSCLQILEAFLWFVLITLLNVTLIILTLSVSRLLNLLLRLVAFLLFLNPQCLASISRWITASSSWKRFCLFVCRALSSIMVICMLTAIRLLLTFVMSSFLVSMQISISSLQTHNVNRCGRSRHLARKLSLRRKRSSPNVFEMAATETITSIILIKLIRVSLGTVRHPRRFKIVVIDIQITLKQMLRDFIGIRVNRAKKSGMVNITSSVNSRERSSINTILHELNPLFTINVTMRNIKSKNVYSRVNSKATTQWRKTESANGVHLEGVASDNRSS